MRQIKLSKPLLERLPAYLKYLKTLPQEQNETISATVLSRALGLGEVQVRKDLGMVSGAGRPKVGYEIGTLTEQLEKLLDSGNTVTAVLIGAGKLGNAIRDYDGFAEYRIRIIAAFDNDAGKINTMGTEKAVYPMSELKDYCLYHDVSIAILTVPEDQAQQVCDKVVAAGIRAVWNFAPRRLIVPDNVQIRNENLASSLALLADKVRQRKTNLAI
jgi:redox-sensing transcriptional repressor